MPEHPIFDARKRAAHDRRREREFVQGLFAPVLGAAVLTCVAIGIAGIGAFRPAPDPAEQAKVQALEGSVYYTGCNDARAAGAAPIYAGQPGYREELDGDSDGIACEPHRRF